MRNAHSGKQSATSAYKTLENLVNSQPIYSELELLVKKDMALKGYYSTRTEDIKNYWKELLS